MFLLDKILPFVVSYIRPFIKWFLHVFTRLSELQRICYGARAGASRCRQIERSLSLSKQPEIKTLLRELDEAVPYATDKELLYFGESAIIKDCKPFNNLANFYCSIPRCSGCVAGKAH